MRTSLAVFSIVPLALLIATAGTLRSQNAPPATSTDRAKRMLAISVLRAINTAEVEYKAHHGVYGTKDAFLASDEFRGKWAPKSN